MVAPDARFEKDSDAAALKAKEAVREISMTNMTTHDINEIKRRMQGASAVLKTELSGLRTGRGSGRR